MTMRSRSADTERGNAVCGRCVLRKTLVGDWRKSKMVTIGLGAAALGFCGRTNQK
jgi:hypothetical protein